MEPYNSPQPGKRLTLPRIIIVLLLLIIVGVAGFIAGYSTPKQVSIQVLPSRVEALISSLGGSDAIDENILDVVWNRINNDFLYRDTLDPDELYYAVLKGLVIGAGDPYSIFLDPKETAEFTSDLEGRFEGIGAEIAVRDEQVTIVAPLKGSPAESAGLKAGDAILFIDELSTAQMDLEEAVSKIRGEKGTEVTLTIQRDGVADLFEITVIRNTIEVASTSLDFKEDIAILTITSFNEDSIVETNTHAQEILLKNPKGLILDLRNNPGGLLDASVDIANIFLEKGLTVVYERDGLGIESPRTTKRDGQLTEIPMVVLINGGSASAAEIVAGGLKDHERAILIGTQTFGKGTVQSFETLRDGSSLKLTVSEWLTPNKESFNETGIMPDTLVELSEDDYTNDRDPQLERALEEFR